MLRRRGREGSIRAGFMLVVALAMLGLMAAVAGGIQPYEGYEAAVASDGPLAQFRFDDAASSGTLTDSVGSFTASNSGIVLGGEGPFGGSRSGSFGGEAFATMPSGPLEGASAFTAEAWVDWTGGSSFKQPIFDFGSSSTNYMYLTPASALSGHKLLFEIHTAGGTVAQVTAPELTAKAWKYVTVSETSSGTLTLYVNGEQVGQSTGETITPAALGSTPSGYLGRSLVSGEPDFKGSLSNVAFYGKALSAERIKAHYDAAELPVNTTAPTISGTVKDGSTLTAKAGSWSGLTPFTFAYQWTRCNSAGAECVQIVSVPETKATETKYTLAHEDVGKTLRIKVTATNSAGEGNATSAQTAVVAAVKPSNKTLPAISGEANVGQLLSVSEGSWEGTPSTGYAYQWETCNSAGKACKHITGATTASYRVLATQVGDTLRAIVTAENSAGSASATSEATAVVASGAPVNIVAPTISGTARDGQTLTASTGSWAGSEPISYVYQWQSCNGKGEACTNIPGASGSSYMLTSSNVDSTLDVVVTASNSVDSTTATSQATAVVAAIPPANTAAPTITGAPTDGQTLTASTGSWSGTPPLSYGYQWQSCNSKGEGCSSIAGATSSTYTLTDGDVGTTLRVAVTAKNAGGEATSSSAASAVVAPLAPANVEPPAISGTAEEGETLTASTGNWSGTPPLEYAYRWERCNSKGECSAIEGALASSYPLRQEDVGLTIGVSVTARNAAGETSSGFMQSAVVKARSPANTSAPTISGNAQEGQTLTVSTGSWSGTPPLTYTYQWQRCYGAETSCTNIAGATASQYTLTSEDVGTTPQVIVTAANAGGSASATSKVAPVVAPTPPANETPPTISGPAQDGLPLAAHVGEWSGSPQVTFTYQWESCDSLGEGCVAIAGATESTYAPQISEVGATLRVVVTATAINYTSAASSSAPTGVIEPGPYDVSEFGSMGTGPAQFNDPGGVAITANGEILVLDRGNDRIEEFNQADEYLGQLGGEGSGDGQLMSPKAIAVGPEGEVWVMDTGNRRVEEFDEDGEYVSQFGVEDAFDEGIAVDRHGDLWISETNEGRLAVFSPNGESLTTVGSKGSGTGQLGEPEGLAFDSTGDVWVADWSHSKVDEFNEAGEFIKEFGTRGTGAGDLKQPYAIAVDANGDVWVGEVGNDRVQEFNQGGTYVAQVGSEGAGPKQLRLSAPIGVAVNANGLWVTDPGNQRVERWLMPPTAPSNTAAPQTAGEAVDGRTLTASPGEWTGAPLRYSYQWQRCNASGGECSDIEGAQGESYELAGADVGMTVRVLVQASNAGGSADAASPPMSTISPATPPSSTAAPTITGAAQDGATLSASTGAWSGTPASYYTYQWESCDASGEDCAQIEYATSPEYPLGEGDIGTTLRVVVTATNATAAAQATSAASAQVRAEPAGELQAPSISGIPDARQVLLANPGAWTGTDRQFSYQWESCDPEGGECAAIEGATEAEYDLGEGDVGTTVRVRVGVESGGAALTDVSSATPVIGAAGALADATAPAVSGRPQNGQTLTASRGAWSGAGTISYAYQWQNCNALGERCEDLPGATGASYVPSAAYAGDAVRVLVTASEEGQSQSLASPVSQPIAVAGAPVIEQPPSIGGTALVGQTLTAQAGTWFGEGGLAYSYQWERCSPGGGCAAVEGATSSSYTLSAADDGATLVALVTATDAGGSSGAVSRPTATIQPESLAVPSKPSIYGVVETEGMLIADTGIWSGLGPVTYAYQWQRCDVAGGACAPIEGAGEPIYLPEARVGGSSLRVEVTATNPLGSQSALSAPVLVPASGEATVEAAEETAEQTDPDLLAPSTLAHLDGQTVIPGLQDGEELSSTLALASSSVSKETPGEFAVDTPDGELSLTPSETSSKTSAIPTLINGTVAFFTNVFPSTDAIVRPEAQGASTILQLRSAQAPSSFSWEVSLGADQQLHQLADGSVAVTSVSEAAGEDEAGGEHEVSTEPEERTGEGEPETSVERARVEREEGESEKIVEVPAKPPAPTSTTTPGMSSPGALEPQNTQVQYETATAAMRSAEAETDENTLMVMERPLAVDAQGNEVPATLGVLGNTVTLSLKPGASTVFPVIVDLSIGAPSDKESEERDPFEYGLADNQPQTFQNFDSRLKSGPLHIKTARLTIPWNTMSSGQSAAENTLSEWLRAVTSHHLEPYITIEEDVVHKTRVKARGPSASEYREAVKRLMTHYKSEVKLWGAWNEPDVDENYVVPERAVEYWQAAQSVARETDCHCTIVAGEFGGFNHENFGYTSQYRSFILEKKFWCKACWVGRKKAWAKWLPHSKPSVWGLHDYDDVVEGESGDLKRFEQYTKLLGEPRIWIGEAGVELNNGAEIEDTQLARGDEAEKFGRQTAAAESFLTLHKAHVGGESVSRIDRIYYYSYSAPPENEVLEKQHEEKGAFDSGLVDVHHEPRSAYCVLAYANHVCPPMLKEEELTASTIKIEVWTYGLSTEASFHFVVRSAGKSNETVIRKDVGPGVMTPVVLEGHAPSTCFGSFSAYAVIANVGGSLSTGVRQGTIICE